MLLVQKYLETHSFGDLIKEHGVYASFSKSGHKFSLNYDQIEAKETDPLAQECRGLILALPDGRPIFGVNGVDGKIDRTGIEPGPTRVLAYPMKRFFNYGQGSAATIDWAAKDLSILEKLDGTLCIVYHDEFTHQWCVATRAVPEADLLMDNGIFTFRTLFEKALQETSGSSFEEYTSKLDKEITYCFELTTPYNRIVVHYPNNGVTLLAAREVLYETDQWGERCISLNELDISTVETYGVPRVQAYTLESVEKTLEWVSSLNPMEHEGVVVKQGDNRIKVKNPAYVAYNRVRDTLGSSERNCVEIILQEKDDDVTPFLPEEIVKNLQKIKIGLLVAIRRHDDAYLMAREAANVIAPNDKKTFAILVTKNKELWTAPFFQMFEGKATNMKDFIQKNRKDGTWSNSFLDKLLDLARQSDTK
jgi:hypothetical protein